MLRVRFATGLTVTYNDANYLTYGTVISVLYDNERMEKWIASIPNSTPCIIEAVSPCKVEQVNASPATMLDYVLEHTQEYQTDSEKEKLKRLKQKLADFNSHTARWKQK